MARVLIFAARSVEGAAPCGWRDRRGVVYSHSRRHRLLPPLFGGKYVLTSTIMNGISRREWLLAAACWGEVLRAQTVPDRLVYFDAARAAEVEALAETILPADDIPGAKEAGVIWFIDRALAGYDKDQQAAYVTGLQQLQERRAALFPGSASVAGLTPEQRTSLLRDMENTDFFRMVRKHTILGFFGHPRHGGNRNGASTKLLGIQETMVYTPPFGYYDREATQ